MVDTQTELKRYRQGCTDTDRGAKVDRHTDRVVKIDRQTDRQECKDR